MGSKLLTKGDITIRVGEELHLCNEAGTDYKIANSRRVIDEGHAAVQNTILSTSDYAEGNYTIALYKGGVLVSTQNLSVVSVFAKQSRIEVLRERLNLIESVIDARMNNDEAALYQMTINNKTFIYESLGVLSALADKTKKELGEAIRNEKRRNGVSPINTIKVRFTR